MNDESVYPFAKMLFGLDREETDRALKNLDERDFQPLAQYLKIFREKLSLLFEAVARTDPNVSGDSSGHLGSSTGRLAPPALGSHNYGQSRRAAHDADDRMVND
jgi:hypothetical protein